MAKNAVGVTSLFIAGDTWNVTKSSCRPSRPKREMLDSQTDIDSYSEKPQTGKMTVTIRPRPDQDSTALSNLVNDTAVLTERSGVIWYGAGLVQTAESEYDTGEGTQDFTFEGTVTRSMAS